MQMCFHEIFMNHSGYVSMLKIEELYCENATAKKKRMRLRKRWDFFWRAKKDFTFIKQFEYFLKFSAK